MQTGDTNSTSTVFMDHGVGITHGNENISAKRVGAAVAPSKIPEAAVNFIRTVSAQNGDVPDEDVAFLKNVLATAIMYPSAWYKQIQRITGNDSTKDDKGRITNATFGNSARKDYMPDRISKLSHWEPLRCGMWKPGILAENIILATAIAMWNAAPEGSVTWFKDDEVSELPGSADIGTYGGLQLILGFYDAGVEKAKFQMYTDGRGRALGVTLRWTMVGRVIELKATLEKDNKLLGTWEEEWLLVYDNLKLVEDDLDLAEGIMEDPANPGKYVKNTNIRRNMPYFAAYDQDRREDARCVQSVVRKDYVNWMGGQKRELKQFLEENLCFIKRDKTVEEMTPGATPMYAHYTYGNLTNKGGEGDVWDMEPGEILDIPKAVVMGTDEAKELGDMETTIDDHNFGLLEGVINKFAKRLTVFLHYKGEVSEPPKESPASTVSYNSSKLYANGMMKQVKRRRKTSDSPGMQKDEAQYGNKTVLERARLGGRAVAVRELRDPSWPEIMDRLRGVDPDVARSHIPPLPDGEVKRTVTVSLHLIALQALTDYCKIETPAKLLRTDEHSLRALHNIALGLSGVLRGSANNAHDLELAAAANIVPGTEASGENVALFDRSRAYQEKRRAKSDYNSTYSEWVEASLYSKYREGKLIAPVVQRDDVAQETGSSWANFSRRQKVRVRD